jgi:hypothetical protein
MPLTGQSNIACFTVPIDKTMVIKRIKASITRANGSPGSANLVLYTREHFGSWNGVRNIDIQTGGGFSETLEGGLVVFEGTDVKMRCESVSDNGTIADAEFEYYLIDNF